MKTVLVTHPGRQHSHQAALALAEAGALAGYWTGVPALASHARGVPTALWRRFVRYPPLDLPADRVRWAPWAPGLRRLAESLLPGRLAKGADFAVCRLFDQWVARQLPGAACEAVIACEISALATFRTAKRLGRLAFLDAPSFHHSAQDRLHGFTEPPGQHRRIVAVKDEEIALADHVITVSELARRTYLAAGVSPEKVHAVPLGADLELFRSQGDRAAASGGPVRFLFVGARIRRKAFDVVVEAFDEMVRESADVHLRLVGPPGDAHALVERLPRDRMSVSGPVPQADLAGEFAAAHCLVLPSRNDSFGMVVAEALAAGCPVIVSDQVGAKDLVAEGRNGWIVTAGDVVELRDRMLACARDRAGLLGMRDPCRRSAETATWKAYAARFTAMLRRLLEAKRP